MRLNVLISFQNNDIYTASQQLNPAGCWQAIIVFGVRATRYVLLILIDFSIAQRQIVSWRLRLNRRMVTLMSFSIILSALSGPLTVLGLTILQGMVFLAYAYVIIATAHRVVPLRAGPGPGQLRDDRVRPRRVGRRSACWVASRS